MGSKKPSRHVEFRRKPYLSRLVPVRPSHSLSVGLSQPRARAHTHLFTLCELVPAETPPSTLSHDYSDVQSQAHIYLPTRRWVSQTCLILQLGGRAARVEKIPFLQNSDTTRANVSHTPQRWCGLASSSVVPALTSVGLSEKHSLHQMLQLWAWILTEQLRIITDRYYVALLGAKERCLLSELCKTVTNNLQTRGSWESIQKWPLH